MWHKCHYYRLKRSSERTFAVHQIQCGVVHSSQELVDPCSVLHCWREVQRKIMCRLRVWAFHLAFFWEKPLTEPPSLEFWTGWVKIFEVSSWVFTVQRFFKYPTVQIFGSSPGPLLHLINYFIGSVFAHDFLDGDFSYGQHFRRGTSR